MMNMDLEEKKRESLLASIRKAGYEIGLMYYECNLESLNEDEEGKKYLLPDGRPNPHWLADGVGDQFYHSLNEIDDYIIFDTTFFDKETCSRDEAWDILDEFFEFDEVEEEAYKGWDNLMNEKYGVGWENQYPTI